MPLQPTNPTPRTSPEQEEGRLSGLLAFILCAAVAAVSLGVCLSEQQPTIHVAQARAAIEKTSSKAPAWLTNTRHEEVLWHMKGDLALLPPWKTTPNTSSFIALAHDSGHLPSTTLLAQNYEGGLTKQGPWVARAYGEKTRPAWDPMRDLHSASVTWIPDNKKANEHHCGPFRLGQWRCGEADWQAVGPRTLVINKKQESCLWLHPVKDTTLRVTWPKVPTGQVLKFRVALSDEAVKSKQGSPVMWNLDINGKKYLDQHHRNRRGWSLIRVDLRNRSEPEVSLSFSVRAEQVGRRFFCMSAATSEATP